MAFFKIRMLSADPVEVPEVMKFRTGKSAVRRDKAQIGKEACGRFIYVSRVGDASERLHKRKGVVKGNGSGVDQQVFYRIMKMAEKSMLEEIEAVQRERKEYREYIEQWIHEVKTPITAIRLLCENHRSDTSRELLAELEHINRYTEQALYYARSEHTEKDYLIREIPLADLVHGAIAENKYLLRQNQVAVTVEEMSGLVSTDDKWVRFILDQLIGNAVKYRRENPSLRFSCVSGPGEISLLVEDNGVGIPAADLPRVFEKGFTGANGRAVQSSTGLGLYLCKRLCDKLGIGLALDSREGKGTTARLVFTVNDYITGVQG